jgi:mono/diheme cytochrome c family protein
MRTVKYFLLATLTMSLLGLGLFQAREEDKPKYTIKEVMKAAHGKNGLLKKVASGNASKEDKEKLLALYTALSQNKPPQGSPDGWKTKTDALVKAAKEAVADEPSAGKDLGKASNCKACHSEYKGN